MDCTPRVQYLEHQAACTRKSRSSSLPDVVGPGEVHTGREVPEDWMWWRWWYMIRFVFISPAH